jgi:hypothetical protein
VEAAGVVAGGLVGVPLLDRGTHLDKSPGERPELWKTSTASGGAAKGRYQGVLWPTCKEGAVWFVGSGRGEPRVGREWDNEGRAVRRARSKLRRYCVHNGLGFMVTLTFRHEPASESGVSKAVALFVRALRRSGIDGAYAWVPERGKLNGRLHVHFGCDWWESAGAVEVCERCASPQLRQVRSDISAAGSFCVGCLWGHGFVGAPSEAIGDPRGVAVYVSKYAAQDFAEVSGVKGRNRYRVAIGHQPVPVHFSAPHLGSALGRMQRAGLEVAPTPLHEVVRGWEGPATWVGQW